MKKSRAIVLLTLGILLSLGGCKSDTITTDVTKKPILDQQAEKVSMQQALQAGESTTDEFYFEEVGNTAPNEEQPGGNAELPIVNIPTEGQNNGGAGITRNNGAPNNSVETAQHSAPESEKKTTTTKKTATTSAASTTSTTASTSATTETTRNTSGERAPAPQGAVSGHKTEPSGENNPETTKPSVPESTRPTTEPPVATGNSLNAKATILNENTGGKSAENLSASELAGFGVSASEVGNYRLYTIQVDFTNNDDVPITIVKISAADNGKGGVYLNGNPSAQISIDSGKSQSDKFYVLARKDDEGAYVLKKIHALTKSVHYAATLSDGEPGSKVVTAPID